MAVRQLAWRAVYELLAARVQEPGWAFMDYGWAPPDPGAQPLALEPADEPDRLCVQLYDHVVAGGVDGRDVLEVGCGRGGGASYLARYRGPATTTGLDLSARAVALCTRDRRGPGLRFVRGDALALPFPDDSFDAVVNVESSHCYPSMGAFLAEVHRVLRPGGDFFWADLRRRDRVPVLGAQLAASGMVVRSQQDLTAGVLEAMRLDDERKLALIDAWIPRAAHRVFRPFAGIQGTRNHTGFVSGELRYLSAWLVAERLPRRAAA